MRAAVALSYGGPEVVRVVEVARPVPGAGEVLVRVHATTVSAGDARIRGARFPRGFGLPARLAFGLGRPRQPVLGIDCAGVVEATGEGVDDLAVGDRVLAMTGMRLGCHAEYAVVGPASRVRLPDAVPPVEAVALAFGGTTALHFLRERGRLAAGERLLVNGAAGAVGAAAVQIGHHLGAHVTAVCSAANAELARSLGADAVIDYARDDFAAGSARWDVVLDAVGNVGYRRAKPVLADGGRLLQLVAGLPEMAVAPILSASTRHRIACGSAPERGEDLATLLSLHRDGALRPVVDRVLPLAAIAEAHARVESGRKVGSVVIDMHSA